MNGMCMLRAPEGHTLDINGILCDWCFNPQSLNLLLGLDDRSLVDALLDFRSVFPRCTESLDRVSLGLRRLLGTGYRVSVVLDYGMGTKEIVRTVCLDANSAPALDNSL